MGIDYFEDEKLMFNKNYHTYSLTTQLRCIKGGEEYVDYIKSIFSNITCFGGEFC